MKKKISLILSLIMIACTVFGYNMPVMASDTTWQNDFEYSISGDNIVLRRYTGTAEDLVIPTTAEIDGVVYNVKLNDDCSGFFKNCTSLLCVDFNGVDTTNVTNVSEMFSGCINLMDVEFKDTNFENVSSCFSMFENNQSLMRILTPMNVRKTIDLPYTFEGYGAPKDGYSYLPKSYYWSFVIKRSGYVPTKFISISTTMQEIGVGDVFSIQAVVKDDKASIKNVRWKSDNPEIASVDDKGNVTGISEGTTIITASTYDNISEDCLVTVSSGEEPVQEPESDDDTTWQNDFEYSINSNHIILEKYKGSAKILKIPSKARINGESYEVKLKDNCSSFFYGNHNLRALEFEDIDTSNVVNMTGMFNSCDKLISLDVSCFDTSNVTNMSGMFVGCRKLLSVDVSGFDTRNVTDMSGMFSGCSSLNRIDLGGFNTSKVTDMSSMFSSCKRLQNIDLNNFDTGNVTNMANMFDYCDSLTGLDLSSFDTGKVTNMRYMFSLCEHLQSIDLSSLNTSSVSNMEYMFARCEQLQSLVLGNWDISNVTNMGHMFERCSSLESIDVGGFGVGYCLNTTESMFSSCNNLKTINIGRFNTHYVTNMHAMFSGCKSLESIDMSTFKAGSATDMGYMFYGCNSLKWIDLSAINASNVKTIDYIFDGCSNLVDVDLSGFDMSRLTGTYASGVFSGNTSLIRIKTPINLKKDVNLPGSFYEKDNPLNEYSCLPLNQASSSILIKKDYDYVAVNGLSIEPITKSVSPGDSFYIVPSITPENASITFVRFSSDNPAVASVDNYGKVTGVTTGETIIKAITIDGGLIASCEVTVHCHDWNNPTYTWSSDNTKCTATRVCQNDATHVETETVDVITEVVTPATCTQKGTTRYTAEFENDAFASQTKMLEDIPAKGHNWNNPTYTWSSDNKQCTATRVCQNDATHVETETVDVTTEVVAPATCTQKGTTRYTAEFENDAFASQTKMLEDIPSTGHNWSAPTYTWSSDNTKCTATRVCQNDASHIETETVDVMTAIVTPATTSTMGTTQYKAVFNNSAFRTQIKQLQDIPVIQPEQQQVPQSVPTQQSTNQNSNTSVKPSSQSTKTDTGIPMYRLYNPNSGEHFYTANKGEMQSLDSVGWNYEGIAWYAPSTGTPVYRMYNPNVGDHHYTMNWAEVQMLQAAGWNYEGEAWKSGGNVKMYRAYNPNATTGSHHYTSNKAEINSIVAIGWKDEGYGWYALR